jgi:hypothetical protein
MVRLSINLIVFATLIASGVIVGSWNDSRQQASDPRVIALRLKSIAFTIGEWEGEEDDSAHHPEDVGPLTMRRYRNRVRGTALSILVSAGAPGPMIVNHPPTTCYPGIGYNLSSAPARYPVPLESSPPAEFLVGRFSRTDEPLPAHLRIFWSWSGSGVWEVPASRLPLARYATVYKLYVIRQMLKPDERLEDDPALEFIKVLVPELERSLFGKPTDSKERSAAQP